MSQTILATIINILAFVLPLLGVEIGSEQLTTTVQTIAVVGTALCIWFRRVSKGDVTVVGKRIK